MLLQSFMTRALSVLPELVFYRKLEMNNQAFRKHLSAYTVKIVRWDGTIEMRRFDHPKARN